MMSSDLTESDPQVVSNSESCPSSNGYFPEELKSREQLQSIDEVANHLAIKTAAITANFTTQWMADHLRLPHRMVDDILWHLRDEKLIEMLGQIGPLCYQYRITNNGLALAKRLRNLCGYIGPTPVSLQEYNHSILEQQKTRHKTSLEVVKRVTSALTLSDDILEVATLAFSSNRSLFIFGPPGNGKSSLGRLLHNSVDESIWIPYAIAVDNQVIRVFDPQYHVRLDEKHDDPSGEQTANDNPHDPRWVNIRRPFVMAGGELTIEQLDLVYDSAANFYEAPPHLKANCGTYFIDDLGRQKVPPFDLLNRWIVPLEQNIDFLSMVNGKKIEVPFQMMLIVATNLNTDDVSDAAFLRRIGYRIFLDNPHEADFRTIFMRQAKKFQLELEPGLLDTIVKRYYSEKRRWKASEPRDLLIRCCDVIDLHQCEPVLDDKILDIAWKGYFSNEQLAR